MKNQYLVVNSEYDALLKILGRLRSNLNHTDLGEETSTIENSIKNIESAVIRLMYSRGTF